MACSTERRFVSLLFSLLFFLSYQCFHKSAPLPHTKNYISYIYHCEQILVVYLSTHLKADGSWWDVHMGNLVAIPSLRDSKLVESRYGLFEDSFFLGGEGQLDQLSLPSYFRKN